MLAVTETCLFIQRRMLASFSRKFPPSSSSPVLQHVSNLLFSEDPPTTTSRTMGLLDLEKHFAFYGAYHSNPINIVIHIIFVWPIVFTALLLLHSATPIFDLSQSLTLDGVLRLNVGFILTVVYALFYLCLDKRSGFVAALMCFSCWVGSSLLADRLGPSLAFKVSFSLMFVR